MTRRGILLLTLLLVLLGTTGYWLYQNVERYSRQVNTGPTLDAIINPWFAAQAFLKQHDIASHRAMDLHEAIHRLQPDDALILFNDTPVYDSNHQQLLTDWMRQGGHLVLAANYEWDAEAESSDDPFLDAMGVRLLWLEEDESEEEAEGESEETDATGEQSEGNSGDAQMDTDAPMTETDVTLDDESDALVEQDTPPADSSTPAEDASNTPADAPLPITRTCKVPDSANILRIVWAEDAEPLQINFGYPYTLEDASGQASHTAGAEPNGLLQYQVGQGRMTVLLDTDIWKNRVIGDFDHAFLLWHLVGDRPRVWFVASHDSENLLQVLWRNARYLLMGLVTLLLLWAWRRWVRFGPLIPDPVPARRQLLEHIEASTLFSWKHQQLEPLLLRLRDDIWLHLNRHHGIDHQDGGSSAEALKKLAELSQQPLDSVRQAMTCPAPQRENNWVELISQLQTIRNAL